MTDLISVNYCDPLQCLRRGNNPRLLQLAVSPGLAAAGGGEWPHDPAVPPAGHQLQAPAWGGRT